VAQALADMGISLPVLHLGIPDAFTEHGDPAALLAELGLDAAGVEHSIRNRFGAHLAVSAPLKRVQ
jgi:1-deoxy-D-xylulose-5-phosphate synthase